jgi:DNA-binding response OmpR family regulator
MMPLVFVVDGAPERRTIVQYALEREGYTVEAVASSRALEAAEQRHPAVMIMAIDLPDANGIDLCQKVRRCPELARTRIILLADNKMDKFRMVLKSEADDCVSMPLAPGELALRVEAVLHSAERLGSSEMGDVVINSAAMKVKVRGSEIITTTLEFRLIDYMARHQGKVFTRDALLDAVWGDLQFVTPRSVDACVRRIRRKIEHDSAAPTILKTVRGIGYKLDAKPIWETALTDFCQCPTCSAIRLRSKSATAVQGVRGATLPRRAASLR